jgi:ectoine hydroxylase-related dioxygenase (phytanoyl-CoA dioxygenase family)
MTSISEQFNKDGFYHAKGVFKGQKLRELQKDFDKIVDQLNGSGEQVNALWGGKRMKSISTENQYVVHTHQVQNYSSAYANAFHNKKFLDITEEIIGPDIILHHSKLFMKPPKNGAPFPMHQDWAYFPTIKDSMIAGVIHLSKATDEMGCFRVYPGSHKLGRLTGMAGQESNERENPLAKKYPLDGSVALEAKPGDVLFFHYFLLHGSKPNISSHSRKTVLVQMHAGDDEPDQEKQNHLNSKLTLRGWNHHMTRGKANV